MVAAIRSRPHLLVELRRRVTSSGLASDEHELVTSIGKRTMQGKLRDEMTGAADERAHDLHGMTLTATPTTKPSAFDESPLPDAPLAGEPSPNGSANSLGRLSRDGQLGTPEL